MAYLISAPSIVEAVGTPPKKIAEYVGRVNTKSAAVSLAIMESPMGWSEPGQSPTFDEYSIVIDGELQVETQAKVFTVEIGQAVCVPAGEWVRYSTPAHGGARYVSACLPAFSPEMVNRDVEN
jgi:ethanolamine utilization protein EutQ (cupin superfamily)